MFKNLITASINLHQLKQIISVFLSKFRYHVCIQPLTDEQLQTLQTGLYNMICKKARMTRGRHIFINATNSHFGLNITWRTNTRVITYVWTHTSSQRTESQHSSSRDCGDCYYWSFEVDVLDICYLLSYLMLKVNIHVYKLL